MQDLAYREVYAMNPVGARKRCNGPSHPAPVRRQKGAPAGEQGYGGVRSALHEPSSRLSLRGPRAILKTPQGNSCGTARRAPSPCPGPPFAVQSGRTFRMRWEPMVKIIYRDKEWEVKAGMTVRDAILKVGLNPLAVLALREGKLIHENTILREGDVIKLVSVVSGG